MVYGCCLNKAAPFERVCAAPEAPEAPPVLTARQYISRRRQAQPRQLERCCSACSSLALSKFALHKLRIFSCGYVCLAVLRLMRREQP